MRSRLYDIYSGDALVIAERIQQLRLQLAVHSHLYKCGSSIIEDDVYDSWKQELLNYKKQNGDLFAELEQLIVLDSDKISETAVWLLNRKQQEVLDSQKVDKKEKKRSVKRKLF